jgi:hypothetical protein
MRRTPWLIAVVAAALIALLLPVIAFAGGAGGVGTSSATQVQQRLQDLEQTVQALDTRLATAQNDVIVLHGRADIAEERLESHLGTPGSPTRHDLDDADVIAPQAPAGQHPIPER